MKIQQNDVVSVEIPAVELTRWIENSLGIKIKCIKEVKRVNQSDDKDLPFLVVLEKKE